LVLQKTAGPRLPIGATETVADAVRRALISHADEPVSDLLSGHTPDGGPVQHDHLAAVPLAHVASRYASGDLLGVALIPPAAADLSALTPLYRAIGHWEESNPDATGAKTVQLLLGNLGVWSLRRELGISPLRTLQSPTWTRPSRRWATATPMVLDQHPGSMARQQARAVSRANASIVAACLRIGLPEPVEIEQSQAPFITGTGRVSSFTRRPGTKDPRPLVHVRLRFADPVTGPVLLGAARYRGLGLFWPVGDRP
jgi:CRISPR-associated protein Csb2